MADPNADLHKEHRQRLKQEFRENGLEHFYPHRVLELALFYAIARKDTNPLSHRLIKRFGSISGVFDADYEMLMEVEGVGLEIATYIKLVAALAKYYLIDAYSTKDCIKTIPEAKSYMEYRFLSDAVERVMLVCLGPGGKIIYVNTVATGSLEKVQIVPTDIIKICLRIGAVRAILAHNHPGGICNPSRADRDTTYRVYEELKRVDVDLVDHIIVASDGVYSMREGGTFLSNPSPTY